jgi:hypothetical protein
MKIKKKILVEIVKEEVRNWLREEDNSNAIKENLTKYLAIIESQEEILKDIVYHLMSDESDMNNDEAEQLLEIHSTYKEFIKKITELL